MPDSAPHENRDPVQSAETSDGAAPAGAGRSGWRRIRTMLTGRPSRGQLIAAVLLAVLGFAAAVQIGSTREDDDLSGRRREDLVDLLDSLSAAADRAQTNIDDLESTRNELQSSTQRRETALEESRRRLEVLGILAGTMPAVGPGVTITIEDPEASVKAASLLNGIEELRDAGAEAIEFNDTARVVASTEIVEDQGQIMVDGVALRPPYVIDAIGASHTLGEAVVFPGGLADDVTRLGGTVDVQQSDIVNVGSLHEVEPAEYAQPTDE